MSVNPYESHKELSSLEKEVLWEYAKLADKIKRLSELTKANAESPSDMLVLLRQVEKQMGLVLTLYKSSVYSAVTASNDQYNS